MHQQRLDVMRIYVLPPPNNANCDIIQRLVQPLSQQPFLLHTYAHEYVSQRTYRSRPLTSVRYTDEQNSI